MRVNTMGDFFGAETEGTLTATCPGPECSNSMHPAAELCRECSAKVRAKQRAALEARLRLRIRRHRQPRYEAALKAGWTNTELYTTGVPSWTEICKRDLNAVPLVVRVWWEKQ